MRSPPRAYELHAWLMMAARTWGVRLAAPTSVDIARSQHALAESTELMAEWRELVTSVERAVFADHQSLPENWVLRAARAASLVAVPSRVRWLPNQRRDWWPTATTFMVVMLLIPIGLAQSASTAKMAAELVVARHWNSPAAHHRIAVSHLEKQELNTALAHALTAFAQDPNDERAATLQQTLAGNESAARDIRDLLAAKGLKALPRQFSPATWQRIALVSALLTAAMLCTLLVLLFQRRSLARFVYATQRATPVIISTTTLLVGVFVVATTCWQQWGVLNKPSAAITLRTGNLAPIPTDLLPEQETTRLDSGSVITVQRKFLDWRKVETTDGLTGWVRKDTLFPVFNPAVITGTSLSHSASGNKIPLPIAQRN